MIMKSLVTAVVLFLSVILLISVNSFILNDLIEYTEKNLGLIPETLKELENISTEQKEKISASLENIEKKWNKKETFLCLSLKHNVSREFAGQLIPAKSYFDSEEYPEFLALILSAKDTLKHISYDEGFKIGNIL